MTSFAWNILIIDNNSPFVLPLIRSFSGYPGIKLDVLLFTNGTTGPFRYSRYVRKIFRKGDLEEENFTEVVSEIVRKSNTDLIIPTRESISVLINRSRSQLQDLVKIHPQSDSDTLEMTGNKRMLNQWLKRNDFPYAMVTDLHDTWPGGYPVLLKPVQGIGGKGIQVIHDPPELSTVLDQEDIHSEDYILQEYLPGYDIDFSLFAVEGKILFHTIQRGIISGSFVYSKAIEFVKNEALYTLVEEIIRRLNYTGIAHLDFRYVTAREEFVLIDFNARYWSSVQGSRAMGVNFPFLAAAYVLGEPVESSDYRQAYYYFATTAIKRILRNPFSKQKLPVRLKDTQLRYVFCDPLPEVAFFIHKLIKPSQS